MNSFYIESSIPDEMTIAEYRRSRCHEQRRFAFLRFWRIRVA